MRRIFFTFILSLLSCLYLSGCSSSPTTIEELEEQGYIFGNIQVLVDNNPRTDNARVIFTHGATVKLSRDGFVAVKAPQGHVGILKINLNGSSTDYLLPNLDIRVGPSKSKTYFGHILVAIKRPEPGAVDLSEKWNWNVANRWKEGVNEWNQTRGKDKLRLFAALAEKIGPDRPLSKPVPTGRQQINTGF